MAGNALWADGPQANPSASIRKTPATCALRFAALLPCAIAQADSDSSSFTMSLTPWIIVFQFVAGIVATCIVIPSLRIPPAGENIDHPSRPWRIFYRIMTVLMCNLWSGLLMLIAMAALSVKTNFTGFSDLERALVVLAIPLPLLPVFYWLFAMLVRWIERNQRSAR
ncbi:hypothetical protein LDO31_13360 [Luteimonas sp. XNQY3]|nr:hypothetical protein [Luteimonas sp. XNQY3]MCD9007205.1 hypothetical protein [Luteimonas sp. XNQY3]